MQANDRWTSGDAYQRFMGRWSPFLAELFIPWLAVPAGGAWLDVGCGTGALSRSILAQAAPGRVLGVDPSAAFVDFARQSLDDPRAQFELGSADSLPVVDASFDAAVAGLVLNFVPDPAAALAEMQRALRAGGQVGAYVWDYSEGMRMVRVFFDAAIALDPAASEVDEGPRFPLCYPEALASLFTAAGLRGVETRPLEFSMHFADFDDYWQPFTGGVGPAPAYLMSLTAERQTELQAEVRRRLPINPDGSLQLPVRAWAVKGRQ